MPQHSRTIERERGQTYNRHTFAVYEEFTYPRGSILAGQSGRRYIDGGFETPEAAKAAHPEAQIIDGSTFQAPCLAHLPDEDVTPGGYNDRDEADDYRNEE